eukprot:g3748.t1
MGACNCSGESGKCGAGKPPVVTLVPGEDGATSSKPSKARQACFIFFQPVQPLCAYVKDPGPTMPKAASSLPVPLSRSGEKASGAPQET